MSTNTRVRHSQSARVGRIALWCVAIYLLSQVVHAQTEEPTPTPAVELSVPEELELKALVDAVSRETGLKIIYDEKVATKKITVRSPGKIPVDTLESLLQSTLRMHGLALIDSEVKGWKTIIDATQKQRMFELGKNHREGEPAPPPDSPILTQIFELEFADPTQVQTAVSGLLSTQGGNSIVLPEQRMIIITDFANIGSSDYFGGWALARF